MAKAKSIGAGFSQLCPRALAITLGIIFGVDGFLQAVLNMWNLKIIWYNPQALGYYQAFYPGLGTSWAGAFMGLIWGAIAGIVFGFIVASVYNWSLKRWACR